MRRCVSDASALAEGSFGGSIPPRSALINFFVIRHLLPLGIVPSANRPTFEAHHKVLLEDPHVSWSNLAPKNRFISHERRNLCTPLCLKLGYRQIPRLSMFIISTKPLVPVASLTVPYTGKTFSPPNCWCFQPVSRPNFIRIST